MIECLRCKKQYTGETIKRMLRERFKSLKNTDKPPTIVTTPMPQQQFLAYTLQLALSLSAKDMRLILLELQRPSNNGSRLRSNLNF